MIGIRDLKIGNIILLGKLNVPTMDDVKYNEVVLDVKTFKKILNDQLLYSQKGILLTEERLVKFGFKKRFNTQFEKRGITIVNNVIHENEPNFMYFKKLGLVPLQYVHQLQNLYFALTGEELELK